MKTNECSGQFRNANKGISRVKSSSTNGDLPNDLELWSKKRGSEKVPKLMMKTQITDNGITSKYESNEIRIMDLKIGTNNSKH